VSEKSRRSKTPCGSRLGRWGPFSPPEGGMYAPESLLYSIRGWWGYTFSPPPLGVET